MSGTTLRRAAIFSTATGLGVALTALLAREPAGPVPDRPRVPVVEVPAGTEIQGPVGIPGFSLVDAQGGVASEVRDIVLADGSRVPFRPMLLRYATERPLPSPAKDVRRVALTDPDLLLLPVPRTRAEYEASAKARPTRMRSPAGTLDHGPGEAMVIHMTGGARVEMDREGIPWTFEGAEAAVELPSRVIRAPCPVSIASPDLEAKGRTLRASEAEGDLVLEDGAAGTIAPSAGVRIGGGEGGGEIRFSCARLFRVLRLPAPTPADGLDRFRVTLDGDATIEQGDGRLQGPHLEVDVARAPGAAQGESRYEAIRGAGGVTLTGGREGRDTVARGRRLLARPLPGGRTAVELDGDPSLDVRETDRGAERRTLHAEGRGPATLILPAEEGPLKAEFRGGASGLLVEPPAAAGGTPVRREVRARTLRLEAHRAGSGAPTEIRELFAEGDAAIDEAERRARAANITWSPLPGGASRTVLRESVAVTWPAAGAMDPLASLAPGTASGAGSGMLLLAAPREAILDAPAEGDTTTGASLFVRGGAVLRRVVGEQEIYRLTCGRLEAALQPGNRGMARLDATVDPRLEGREEGPGGRRYDFRGARITVLGAPGTTDAQTAEVLGDGAAKRAFASFVGDDGRPLTILSDRLHIDRTSGAFHADGTVRGTGVLPESSGGAVSTAGGRTEIACRSLEGVLAPGGTRGATRVRSLAARDEVWLKTETEYASGERLDWDGSSGGAILRGDPARVTARSAAAPAGAARLEDLCEAPELRILLQQGRLLEARSEGGGRLVRHRVPATPAPPERVEARCRGPFSYRPEETTLEEAVSLVRSILADGAFVEKDRIERADRLRLVHPPAADGSAGRLEQAAAESSPADMEVVSGAGEWKATGVSRATLASAADTVVLESSARSPRFRVEGSGGVQNCRSVVYDYAKRAFTEIVGATAEGGR